MESPFMDAEARVRSLDPSGRLLSVEPLTGGVSSHTRRLVFEAADGVHAMTERRDGDVMVPAGVPRP